MSVLLEATIPHRKRLTAEEKLRLVTESHEPGVCVAEIARKYNVGASTLVKWRKQAMEGSLMGVKNDESLVPLSEVKKLQKEIKQLQRLLGKKSVQVEILQEAIELAREKKLISRQPLPGVDDIA